jgi:molybdopterin-guanine dinucleotide biosynthesis protein A
MAGYVMAGGASRRFGSDKAFAEFGGRTLLSHMCELVLAAVGDVRVVAPEGRYAELEFPILDDRWPDEGPLGGIITALGATERSQTGAEWNLILSCDMPFLTREWLEFLSKEAQASDAEVVVPRSGYGLEPLCACWRTSAVTALQGVFEGGVRKVTEAMKRLRVEVLDESHWKRFDTAGQLFWNMNTSQDYETALHAWGMRKS